MLNNWIEVSERAQSGYLRFGVVDVEQVADVSEEIADNLTDMLVAARFEPTFLAEVAGKLGWATTNEWIASRQKPLQAKMRRGDFGEALMNRLLEENHDYVIPVPKLRFKITRDQSQPSTDTLALKLDDTLSVVEVCYVESKVRTTSSTMIARDSCQQLRDDYTLKLPDILLFVAQRLYERKDPMFDAFVSYMRDRTDNTHLDSFRIGIFYEKDQWSELILQNLEESEPDLPKLCIHSIRIAGLKELIDGLFVKIGAGEVIDD